jgi:RNA polymerase sigma factor (sigma-70 family)
MSTAALPSASALASAPASASVASLVVRARGGDDDATAALVQRFSPAVYAFARRRLRTPEAVAEFAQDALLVFVEALRRGAVHEPERVGGFVLGICQNISRERARTADRRQALWERYGSVVDAAPDAERDRYAVAHLEDCVSQLSGRARDVIRLAYVAGADNGEIARDLELSEGNVRVLRHRTLKALRECLDKRMSWEAL